MNGVVAEHTSQHQMILGIDASNLRAGGGLTHLAELLRAARPDAFGFDRVKVWAGASTLRALPDAGWLEPVHERALDGSIAARLAWQLAALPRRAKGVDLLLAPGGTSPDSIHPQVVISQNMLPFDERERARYGATPTHARLLALRYLQGRAFTRADGVVFLSEFARDRISRALEPHAPKHVSIIPHGIGARFRHPPRAARPLAGCSFDDPLRVLYVSIISPYKHQWAVLEAIAALRAAGTPISIDFIGSRDDEASTERLRATVARVDPRGEFATIVGSVEYAKVHERYQRAELFVFASSCENMPNILLEAMAAGLPIACSDRGPMPEVLGDAGVYFDPESSDDIARAVRELADDPALRERCAERASRRAESFTWTRCADETFKFLAETVTRWRIR